MNCEDDMTVSRTEGTSCSDRWDKIVISCDAGSIVQPVRGKVIPLEEVPDAFYAGGILGPGVGIEPEEGVVTAPCDGTISFVAVSRHAIGLTTVDNMEVLIHVGVDTVKMNGEGFTLFVAAGDKVRSHQKMLQFDRNKIREAGYADTVVVLLTNGNLYTDVKSYVDDDNRAFFR